MKKILVLAACFGATAMAFGQGQFNLSNRVLAADPPIDARVTDSNGDPISGAGWVLQAYMSSAEDGSYAPIAGTIKNFRTTPAAGLGYLLDGGIVTVAGSPGGTSAWIKLYTWNTNDGASYEAAEAAFGAIGISNAVNITLAEAPNTPEDLQGLMGWSVAIIPEPSTMALGLLGIGALMLRRRR